MTAKLDRARIVIERLRPLHPDFRPLLEYTSPFTLLVATVLSAQCTDAMVNRVTPALFARFPGPPDVAGAHIEDLEGLIRPTGFYHSKARNLIELSRTLIEKHGGEVPRTMEELTALRGVGRKTAGVVLSVCFGLPAIIVDTHFGRVARRLGFTASEDPATIERDIAEFLPMEDWTAFSHILNRHGRNPCLARSPRCAACPLRDICFHC